MGAAVFNVTKCGSCPGRVIRATTTVGGQPMEVDADPHPDGMLLLQWRNDTLYVEPVPKIRRETVRRSCGGLYRSHLVTCTAPSAHRRSR